MVMRQWILAVFQVVLSFSFLSDLQAATQAESYSAVAERASRSVVTVYARRPMRSGSVEELPSTPYSGYPEIPMPGESPLRPEGLGSGVIITAAGHILTNQHVVCDAESLTVTIPGCEPFNATVVGSDAKSDIAVIKIDPGQSHLVAIEFADSSQVAVGDVAIAVGNPYGVGQSLTLGIISAVSRTVGILDFEDFLQTDASINPGNSGGPLLNSAGQLIGINTAIVSRTGGNIGIGFAVPSNYARTVADSILANGKVVRGYLGIAVQRLTPVIGAALEIPATIGVLVSDVVVDSPAHQAGIQAGDVIIAIDGHPIAEPRQVRLIVSGIAPGTTVDVSLVRKSGAITLRAKARDLADTAAEPAPPAQESRPQAKGLGIQVHDLDELARCHLCVPEHITGAMIIDSQPGSRAWNAGLRTGDVIHQVNGVDAATCGEAARSIRNVKDGTLLLRVWNQNGSRFVAITDGPMPEAVNEDNMRQRVE
jgi:serine protease Do